MRKDGKFCWCGRFEKKGKDFRKGFDFVWVRFLFNDDFDQKNRKDFGKFKMRCLESKRCTVSK